MSSTSPSRQTAACWLQGLSGEEGWCAASLPKAENTPSHFQKMQPSDLALALQSVPGMASRGRLA